MADLDLVILGASGTAGAPTARYVAARAAETGVRWAAAGREQAKIERRLEALGVTSPEIIVADVDDPPSLAALAARSRVVLNAVGPYTTKALPVIEACVRAGAHYVDLTGEIAHVRRVIEAKHEQARSSGVKVVQVCGFEALPPDLAVLLAVEESGRLGEGLRDVLLEATVAPPPGSPRVSDWLSRGTRASMLAVSRGEDPGIIAEAGALITDARSRAMTNVKSPIEIGPRRRRGGGVLAPLPPAFINPAVIHRTAALHAAEAGAAHVPFRYREGVVLGSVVAGSALALSVGAIRAGARAGPTIRSAGTAVLGVMFRLLGEGPADDRLNGWTWTMKVQARTSSGRTVRVSVDGDGHPGYLSTAQMFGEAGLLLAEQGATPDRAGCLTPALALGSGSIARFERAGLQFAYW